VNPNESPEDIAKWIADRKKKYPTDRNIEEKVIPIGSAIFVVPVLLIRNLSTYQWHRKSFHVDSDG
jgi:hypothetical protein